MIPILLRVTVARNSFKQLEFTLGKYSVPLGCIGVAWASFMVIVLCLPQSYPVTLETVNYSGIVLGALLIYAVASWFLSAKYWYKTLIDVDLASAAQAAAPVSVAHSQRASLNSDALSKKHSELNEEFVASPVHLHEKY
jgi:hypothetical protein